MPVEIDNDSEKYLLTYCVYCEKLHRVKDSSAVCPGCRERKINNLFGIKEI